MGKQPRVSREKVNEIRLKIRAVVSKNRELQAKVDEKLAAVSLRDPAAKRRARKIAYSDVIRKNQLLRDKVKNIFEIMTP